MNVREYTLVNEEKLDRALNGSMTRGGVLKGGVAELIRAGQVKPESERKEDKDVEAFENALLAQYDRLGGLVLKGDLKLKSGAFWDFHKRQQREKFIEVYLQEVDGEILEVTEKEAEAIEVARKKVRKLKESKKKKKKSKK